MPTKLTTNYEAIGEEARAPLMAMESVARKAICAHGKARSKNDQDIMTQLWVHYTMLAGTHYHRLGWRRLLPRHLGPPVPTVAQLQDTGTAVMEIVAFTLGYSNQYELISQNIGRTEYHKGHIQFSVFEPPAPKDEQLAFILTPNRTTEAALDAAKRHNATRQREAAYEMLDHSLLPYLFHTVPARWRQPLKEAHIHAAARHLIPKEHHAKLRSVLRTLFRPPQPLKADRRHRTGAGLFASFCSLDRRSAAASARQQRRPG